MTEIIIDSDAHPTCKVHADTELLCAWNGWVCPKGCGWEQAGRRWLDHPRGNHATS